MSRGKRNISIWTRKRKICDLYEEMCQIFWPNKISNVDLYKKTGCNSAVLEIKRRRLRCLGHVLRMPKDSLPKSGTELDTTWKKEARTAKDDMATDSDDRAERDGAVVGEAQASAKDMTLWRNIVVALCPTGDEENK